MAYTDRIEDYLMLSKPQARSPLHTREITFQGFAREDGLWDIEGHLRDYKTTPFVTGTTTWQPGEAFHDMWVRLPLITSSSFKILKVVMDGHPHPECPHVIPPMNALIGERLGKG